MDKIELIDKYTTRISKIEKQLKPYKKKEDLVKSMSQKLNSGVIFELVNGVSASTVKLVKSLEALLESDNSSLLLLQEEIDEKQLKKLIATSKKNEIEFKKIVNMCNLNDNSVRSKFGGLLAK